MEKTKKNNKKEKEKEEETTPQPMDSWFPQDSFGIWDSRGTQEPNLSGNSEIRSSFIRSFMGPRMMTGRV